MKEKQDYQGKLKGTLTNDWVAVKLKTINKKESKIILPEGAPVDKLGPDVYDEYPFQGRVIATGPGWEEANGNRKSMPCKVGDTVYLMPRPIDRMMWVKFEGLTYFLFRTGDIIYVV